MDTVCIVGCGSMGRVHAAHLSRFVRLAYCDAAPAAAAALRRRFGGGEVYGDFAAALHAPEVTAMVIATPPQSHAEQAIRALEAGKAVLVEKPLCLSAAEVGAIVGAVDRRPNGLLMVAENYYYKPIARYLRRTVADGVLGTIASVVVRKQRLQAARGWRTGLGALLEGGIHFVALISDILGRAPESVSAVFPGRAGNAPERRSITRLAYSDGARAELRYSWDTPHPFFGAFQHSRISGREGSLLFESNGLYAWLDTRSRGPRILAFPADLTGRRRMTADFLACLADRSRRPYSDVSKAARDLQIVFEAYRSL